MLKFGLKAELQVVVALFPKQVILFVIVVNRAQEAESQSLIAASPCCKGIVQSTEVVLICGGTANQQIVTASAFQLIFTGAAEQDIQAVAATIFDAVLARSAKDKLRNGSVDATVAALSEPRFSLEHKSWLYAAADRRQSGCELVVQ